MHWLIIYYLYLMLSLYGAVLELDSFITWPPEGMIGFPYIPVSV